MKHLNTRVLGIIGIIGAPWMFIDFINNGLYDHFLATSVSGIRNFMFMTGWVCSVIGLYKLEAMGTKRWQKAVIITQIIFLLLADCWSIFEMFAPESPSPLFYALNFLWPVAGFFMVVTGVVILLAKRLRGWKRYVPLLAGFWFPETVTVYYFTRNSWLSLVTSGIYSTIVFSLLGLSLLAFDYEAVKRKAFYKP
jgi:hypothetical protein